jgi:hypothetical protein
MRELRSALLPAEERPHEVEDETDGEAALQLSTRSDTTPAACLSPAIDGRRRGRKSRSLSPHQPLPRPWRLVPSETNS